uniref:Uncharacterized protein n=1 Tax=Coccolithus braarudii TaxID=221442 RepID=A0A7S0L243_9EUKA|mmetsp:Transcript_1604/g.3489  ORF Transcript_1604/g.3489 Transcript_1604/m.3489 type:complete len:240 (+) Transcript_1604:43-762(+)
MGSTNGHCIANQSFLCSQSPDVLVLLGRMLISESALELSRSLIAVSSVCVSIRDALQPLLAEQRDTWRAVDALCTKMRTPVSTLPAAAKLDWPKRGMVDEDVALLVKIIASGALKQLKVVILFGNKISDSGMQMLASAVAMGSLEQVKGLYLGGNLISDAGIKAFASAVTSSKRLGQLQSISFRLNKFGDAGIAALTAAVTSGAMASLSRIHIRLGFPEGQCTLSELEKACASRRINLS